ncbi:hypothetical protein LWF01_05885 [Saxibacter everestensis]|uniref:Ornithine cyclodeaminase n=1 Tax=Saxibacter everestensis TaxID=2909229 RepID=A0ABY8QWA3_9MICO|nr:hypothetical protein LWF01_05885 [Brevibacteriaceae bacterium ZFBP1038]
MTEKIDSIERIGVAACHIAVTDDELVQAMDRAGRIAGHPELTATRMAADAGEDLIFGHSCLIPGLGMCVKTGIQKPGNRAKGIDTVQAAVLLFENATGRPVALVDGKAVTTMRTAGALVAGIRALRPIPQPRVAVIGFGSQGRQVAELSRTVLGAAEVRAYTPSGVAAEDGIDTARTIAEAAAGADVVACCTSSPRPVISRSDLADDVVVGTMNSFSPALVEIEPEIIGHATTVLVDNAPENFGPIVQWTDAGGRLPVLRYLGQVPPPRAGDAGARGIRAAFVGGTGYQDALVAWSVVLGWSQVEEVTRQYT